MHVTLNQAFSTHPWLMGPCSFAGQVACATSVPRPFKNKPVLLMSALEHGGGSCHCLSHLRDVLVLNEAAKASEKTGKAKGAELRKQAAARIEELIVLTERPRF